MLAPKSNHKRDARAHQKEVDAQRELEHKEKFDSAKETYTKAVLDDAPDSVIETAQARLCHAAIHKAKIKVSLTSKWFGEESSDDEVL